MAAAGHVQTISLPFLPDYKIYAALYKDVKNAEFLRQQLLAGNKDFDYAFLDASSILSTTHLHASLFRALNDHLHQRLRSRTIHSEIVFSLSPNNNINESFRRFGLSASTTSLIAMKVALPNSPTTTTDGVSNGSAEISEESVTQHLESVIEGTRVEFCDEEIEKIRGMGKIRKYYKLGNAGGDEELEAVVLGIMALKGS